MDVKGWNYKGFEIEESLKPGADKFQYFFRVKKTGAKKCTYCIWITDDIINIKSKKASKSEQFEDVTRSNRETWVNWVKSKIDQGVLGDLALKIDATGENEIKLSELGEKVEF
ncbi:MAG: hypothetical protein ACFFCD_10330 [Promethearchaeota archaeon]